MHKSIQISYDHERGCGFRSVAGSLYLRSDDAGVPCAALPLEFTPCPTCESMGLKCGVKFSRGFTWINPSKLWNWGEIKCATTGETVSHCRTCSMGAISNLERCGLLWIGGGFYETPETFDKEARELGISRRLPHDQIPRNFTIGTDFIMLAHQQAVLKPFTLESMANYAPGVFRVFRPSRIEVICSGEESDDVIEGYLKRGLTPVKVERVK